MFAAGCLQSSHAGYFDKLSIQVDAGTTSMGLLKNTASAPVCWLYRWRMSCVGMISAELTDAPIWNSACNMHGGSTHVETAVEQSCSSIVEHHTRLLSTEAFTAVTVPWHSDRLLAIMHHRCCSSNGKSAYAPFEPGTILAQHAS